MKSVAFFSIKGGVGKTTIACNLACFMAKSRGFRVLLIDADSQAGATQYLLSDEQLRQYYSDTSRFCLNDYYESIGGGEKILRNFPDVVHASQFGIDLIPADPSLLLQQDKLARAWQESLKGSRQGLNVSLTFQYLLHEAENNYDLIFVDMSPAINDINRQILLATDYFIMPVAPDRLTFFGIDKIFEYLRDSHGLMNSAFYDSASLEFQKKITPHPRRNFNSSFMGFILNNVSSMRFKGERYISHSEDLMTKSMESGLEKIAAHFDCIDSDDALLGTVPALSSLLDTSMHSHIPVFELGTQDGVFGAQFARVDDARISFKEISEKILSRIGNIK